MIYQQFGELTGLECPAECFLCIDSDLPNEFLISIIPETQQPFAVLAIAENVEAESFKLTTRNLLRPQSNGGLIYPVLSKAEQEALKEGEIILNVGTDGNYSGTWKSGGNSGSLNFRALPTKSDLKVETVESWKDFKNWVNQVQSEKEMLLFRGHGSSKFELSTTLHRSGRNRIDRYCAETLTRFHSEVESELSMRLNLNDSADYSVVLGLAQHHGLPTPMLDWTKSPYVAAFFAFSDAFEAVHRKDVDHVRVIALSRWFVEQTSPPNVVLTWPLPFVASLAISSLHNPRLRAQQGHFMVTNIANLGTWLEASERKTGKRFMRAIDIPISSTAEALQDLAFMGLTAATMFPGLDGVCKAIRHEMAFTNSITINPGSLAPGQNIKVGTETDKSCSIPESFS